MTHSEHQAAFEELTAYLDGELGPVEASRVRTHLAGCSECRQVEAELRGVSARLASWTVGDPPSSLSAPRASSSRRPVHRWLPLAAGLVFSVGIAGWWASRTPPMDPRVDQAAATSDAAAPTTINGPTTAGAAQLAYAERLSDASVPEKPLLARSASLSIVAADFTAARAEMERIVSSAGGFTGNITASVTAGEVQSLRATLRIPSAVLDATLDALKRLGRVRRESREADDVSRQSSDLDARLANARLSEGRLKEILARRTGDLADVLNVEREIARVRGEIERMEAERKGLDRRITYATVSLELKEEDKAAMDLGPIPVSTRLRNAFVEGWRGAFSGALETALLAARVMPALLLCALVLALPVRWLRRGRWFDTGVG